MATTILQIIPCDGWFAGYEVGEVEEFIRIGCWGLFETDEPDGTKSRYVAGIDPQKDCNWEPVTDTGNYTRTIHFDDLTADEKKRIKQPF